MRMNVFEMEGFLRGKCVPRDLKVNETNAEYLVRKFAEAEAKCAALAEDQQKAIESIKQADAAVKLAHEKFSALAAENAGLKHAMAVTLEHVSVTDAGQAGVAAMIINDALHHSETPATDAFLAEVRAQGVEMYADNLDNGADDAERGGFDYAVKFLRSEASGVRLFADQLRKGGNQ
ncbi:TPA: hypothetical protein HJO04_002786 [Escherichia coli]|nr:hypothetical protein [Escherichia coli]EAY2184037.1 hypothetical protein [Salmonella enterica subsp. enterica serovar Typhimurium]MCI6422983.1 hypothetical protein [Shigella flexneri]HAJ6407936.1 hypothetical protein [Escherichia coli HVH 93 (4-5851025)]HCH8463476.1 hypothetical protein [Shigella sonnei]HCO5695319.1 hypothetical protein [Escherichia fergusonii]